MGHFQQCGIRSERVVSSAVLQYKIVLLEHGSSCGLLVKLLDCNGVCNRQTGHSSLFICPNLLLAIYYGPV